jgi:hypothetical protein
MLLYVHQLYLIRCCATTSIEDQATEFIIDTALELKKPFAVVPCCVFTKLFPDRRTPEGGEVRSYDDLVVYLQHKDPGIRREYLPYLCGRNVVLYKLNYDEEEERGER